MNSRLCVRPQKTKEPIKVKVEPSSDGSSNSEDVSSDDSSESAVDSSSTSEVRWADLYSLIYLFKH